MNAFHTGISVETETLFKLERRGRYEEALAELRHIWEDTNSFPDIENYAPREAAEVILRCGALIGFLGQIKQIPNSQEKSKNLLTEARLRFLDIYDLEKIIECENYIALAYVRTGELVEAEAWVEEALSHNVSELCDAWLYSNITKSLIFQLNGKYKEILETLFPLKNDFLKFGSFFLSGSFCTNVSLAFRETGDIFNSQKYLELARTFHKKSGHQIYLGTVENNLAQVYKLDRKFAEAHKRADSAISVFRKLKDRAREGFAYDTKADIFCAEGRYEEALATIEKALTILRRNENAAFTVETYLSKAKILLRLDNFTAAFLSLSDAVQLAKSQISEERAESLVREFEALMKEKNAPVISRAFNEKEASADENLELILPPTIAHYREIQGVWINNSHLENFGLRKGTLAVVGKTELKRGDLAAVNEIATDSVLCGFYDSDFGLVCLEGIGDEPRFFDENEIEVLGKIVGIGRADKKLKNKIHVEPLNI